MYIHMGKESRNEAKLNLCFPGWREKERISPFPLECYLPPLQFSDLGMFYCYIATYMHTAGTLPTIKLN